jgi:hypothetical protein
MKAASWPLVSILLLSSLAGCRMCLSPFDYCNPMIGPSGCLNCDFGARRNSAIHPMDDDPPQNLVTAAPPAPGESYERGVPDPAAERGYDPTAQRPDDGQTSYE